MRKLRYERRHIAICGSCASLTKVRTRRWWMTGIRILLCMTCERQFSNQLLIEGIK